MTSMDSKKIVNSLIDDIANGAAISQPSTEGSNHCLQCWR